MEPAASPFAGFLLCVEIFLLSNIINIIFTLSERRKIGSDFLGVMTNEAFRVRPKTFHPTRAFNRSHSVHFVCTYLFISHSLRIASPNENHSVQNHKFCFFSHSDILNAIFRPFQMLKSSLDPVIRSRLSYAIVSCSLLDARTLPTFAAHPTDLSNLSTYNGLICALSPIHSCSGAECKMPRKTS
jgi:hypothetical protein